MRARVTCSELAIRIGELESLTIGLRGEKEILTRHLELEQQQHDLTKAQLDVVRGDRDRLTGTVEVLSRRLASPDAERNPSRSGWRHAQGVISGTRGPVHKMVYPVGEWANLKEEARG